MSNMYQYMKDKYEIFVEKCRDEDYEGCITTHIDGVNDDYDDVDDIVKWIEV